MEGESHRFQSAPRQRAQNTNTQQSPFLFQGTHTGGARRRADGINCRNPLLYILSMGGSPYRRLRRDPPFPHSAALQVSYFESKCELKANI